MATTPLHGPQSRNLSLTTNWQGNDVELRGLTHLLFQCPSAGTLRLQVSGQNAVEYSFGAAEKVSIPLNKGSRFLVNAKVGAGSDTGALFAT